MVGKLQGKVAEGPPYSLERPKSGADQNVPGGQTTPGGHCEDPDYHSDGA
jgi:hypothetical protein